jgi:hypothetical protein
MSAKTLAAAAVAVLALAACGTTGKPSGIADSAGSAPAVAWAECLRSRGVPDFPDPIPGHRAQFPDSAAGTLNSHAPAVLAAEKACQPQRAAIIGTKARPGDNQTAALLEYARCMRAHGVPSYPDPTSGNNRQPSTGLSRAGIDTRSPAFSSAARACNGHGIPAGLGVTER